METGMRFDPALYNRARSAAPIKIRSIFLIGAQSQVRADL
jgi:hypothetical protein